MFYLLEERKEQTKINACQDPKMNWAEQVENTKGMLYHLHYSFHFKNYYCLGSTKKARVGKQIRPNPVIQISQNTNF